MAQEAVHPAPGASLPVDQFSSFASWRWWSEKTTAVVTGANKGIGLEIARKMAEEGLRVVLTARQQSKGLDALHSLAKQGLTNVHFLPLDVANPSSVSSFLRSFEAQFGVLDILVNNAGVSFNDVDGNSVTWEQAEAVVSTNFYGAKAVTEGLLPLFRRSPQFKSRILNVSSRLGSLRTLTNPQLRAMLEDDGSLTEARIEAFLGLFIEAVRDGHWSRQGWPEIWPDYAVSKLALNAYSRVLATRLHPDHIYINCFCPGFTQTSMTGGRGSRTPRAAGQAAALLALLPPNHLQTGKFFAGQQLFLPSKF